MAIDRTYLPFEGDYSTYGFGPEHLFFDYGGSLGLGDSDVRDAADEAEARGTTVEQVLTERGQAADLYFPGGEESEGLRLGGDVSGHRAQGLQGFELTQVVQGGLQDLPRGVIGRTEEQTRLGKLGVEPGGAFLGVMLDRIAPGLSRVAEWSEDRWAEAANNPDNRIGTIENQHGQKAEVIVGPTGEIIAIHSSDMPQDMLEQFAREKAPEIANLGQTVAARPGQAPALETASAPERAVSRGAFGPATPAGGELGGGYGVGAGYGGYRGPVELADAAPPAADRVEPDRPWLDAPPADRAGPAPDYAPPAGPGLSGDVQPAPAPGSPADIAGRTPSTGRAKEMEDLLGQASDAFYGRTPPGNYDVARQDLQAIVDKTKSAAAGVPVTLDELIDLHQGEQDRTQFAGRGEHAALPERTPVISGVEEGKKDLIELGRQAMDIINEHGGLFGPGGQAAVDVGKDLAREAGVPIETEPEPAPAPSIADYMPSSPFHTASALPTPAPVPRTAPPPAPRPSPLPTPAPAPKREYAAAPGTLEKTIADYLGGIIGGGTQAPAAAPADKGYLGFQSDLLGTPADFGVAEPSFMDLDSNVLGSAVDFGVEPTIGADSLSFEFSGAQPVTEFGAQPQGFSGPAGVGAPGFGMYGPETRNLGIERFGPPPADIIGGAGQTQVGGGIGRDYLGTGNFAGYLDAARNEPTGFETATPADLVANYNEQQPSFAGLHEQDRRAEFDVPGGLSDYYSGAGTYNDVLFGGKQSDKSGHGTTQAGPATDVSNLGFAGPSPYGGAPTSGGGDGGVGSPGGPNPGPGTGGPAASSPAGGAQAAGGHAPGTGTDGDGGGGGGGGGGTGDPGGGSGGSGEGGAGPGGGGPGGGAYHSGGSVVGPDPSRSGEETVARLLEGEFVLTPELVDIIGPEKLQAMQAAANKPGMQTQNDMPPLGTEVVGETSEGRSIIQNPDGSVSSERSQTVQMPDGSWVNVPSIYNRHEYNRETARAFILNSGGYDPETGRKLERYDSPEQAVQAARQRSSSILPADKGISAGPFDPFGSGYDYGTASEIMERDETGHMGSRDPRTGMMLKGTRHPTFQKAIDADMALGYQPVLRRDDEDNLRLFTEQGAWDRRNPEVRPSR